MRIHRERLMQAGNSNPVLDRAMDALFRYPLLERARDALGRELRLGITDQALAQMLIDRYEDDNLVHVVEEKVIREPQVICSMGLRREAPVLDKA
jgi:hypothetical protein